MHWLLWSTYSNTAIAIIPEEAELAIAILRDLVCSNKASPTCLLTYAAPITRRMLHFNYLDYYGHPSIPKGWRAPMWLTVELGIFAGRLYFEYEEYEELLDFLGLHKAASVLSSEHTSSIAAPLELDGVDEHCEEPLEEPNANDRVPAAKEKPPTISLTFLQEWLAVRRKGQDFMHTPMGYVCQGKPLKENHPFFTKATRVEVTTAAEHRPTRSSHLASGDSAVQDDTDDFAYEGDFLGDEEIEMDEGTREEDESWESETSTESGESETSKEGEESGENGESDDDGSSLNFSSEL